MFSCAASAATWAVSVRDTLLASCVPSEFVRLVPPQPPRAQNAATPSRTVPPARADRGILHEGVITQLILDDLRRNIRSTWPWQGAQASPRAAATARL
jgi:hypothetical protein